MAGRKRNVAGSQVLVSSEEQVFGVLVSKLLRGILATGDPEGTMFFFLGSWRKGLPDSDATKNLATKERRKAKEVCVEPFEFVEQFRKLLEDHRKESFEDAVAWLAQNFSFADWKRAVQWCGIERILGLFAGGRAPEKDDIEKTLQDCGLTPEETKVLGLGWLKDVVDLDKAHLGLEDQERRGVLTRKEVDDKLKGLTWIKPQPDTQWRWIELLLRTAAIKSDVAFPAVGGAKEVKYRPEALPRIWSTAARIFFEDMAKATLREDQEPKTSWTWAKNKTDIEDLKDEYRNWMLGRAIACETKRMLARAGSATSVETLTVHYEYQGPKTFRAVKGDLNRNQDVDRYYEKLVTEVGRLLSDVAVDGQPVDEVIRKLQEAGDQCDIYNNLVVPGKAATSGWSDIGKLASSSLANYLPEEQRLALLRALAQLVQEATAKRSADRFQRAQVVLRHLKSKKGGGLNPADKGAVEDYVKGDISLDELERRLSPALHWLFSRFRASGDGSGVVAGVGVGGAFGSWVNNLGQGIWDFFEEHPWWFLAITVLGVALGMGMDIPEACFASLLFWGFLKMLGRSRVWWIPPIVMLWLLYLVLSRFVLNLPEVLRNLLGAPFRWVGDLLGISGESGS